MSRQDRGSFGEWKNVKCLGSGGNGEVHLWQNSKTGKKIAVKSSKFSADINEKDKQRWREEIQLARQCSHENIVGSVKVDDEFFEYLLKRYSIEPLLMEYCEKGDLRKKINAKENLNGLPESEIRIIIQCLVSAVKYMHSKKITHRDIKPENLVITDRNGSDVYKLTDLGYARVMHGTIEASHVGTFEYFAPEVITEPSYSYTVDYWSMGIIVFEIICGVRPFLPGSPIKQFLLEIKNKSPETIAITKCVEKGQTIQHKTLFDQNHISSCLKQLLENWLRILLQVEPRKRAIVGKDTTLQPPCNFKLFTDIDFILSAKILTVFSLHNFRLYSYNITTQTTRQGFLETLSLDTGIPVDQLVIILPPENERISRFLTTSLPIELYIENLYDRPMLYCTGYCAADKSDKCTLTETSPNVGLSPLLSRALDDNEVKNEKHGAEVARHLKFYVKLQQRHANLFLLGLLNYAMLVDHWIVKFQGKVNETVSLFWQLYGVARSYSKRLEHAREMLFKRNIQTTLMVDSTQIIDRCGKIREGFERTQNRFRSILKRSHAVVTKFNAEFNSYMESINSKANEIQETNHSSRHIAADMFQQMMDFQEVISTLHSDKIVNLQTTISEIHVEFEKVETIVDILQKEETDTLELLDQEAFRLNEAILEAARSNTNTTDGMNHPDLDVLCSTSVNDMDLSSASISEDAQLIVGMNNDLCEKVASLLNGHR